MSQAKDKGKGAHFHCLLATEWNGCAKGEVPRWPLWPPQLAEPSPSEGTVTSFNSTSLAGNKFANYTFLPVRRSSSHLPQLPKEQARMLRLRSDLQTTTRASTDTTCAQFHTTSSLSPRLFAANLCTIPYAGPPGLRSGCHRGLCATCFF